jgi:hypothetical protein
MRTSALIRSLAAAVTLSALIGATGCGLTTSPGAKNSSGGAPPSAGGTPPSSGGTPPSAGGAPPSSGGSGAPASAPVLAASSMSIAFGNVPVGESTAQLVTLTDAGNSNITISTVSASGNSFSSSAGSNAVLTPNQSVTIAVNFDPTAAGGAQGTLWVASSAADPELQVALSGTGVGKSVQHSVTLSWEASATKVIGYFVYRGSVGNLSKLISAPDAATTFTDSTVADGQTYLYAVTSVDSSDVESVQSAPVSVTIPKQ